MATLLVARGHPDARAFLAAVAFAAGATLQAHVGARLVRRLVPQPLTLTLPGDVARFIAACTASSVVSATVATIALPAGRPGADVGGAVRLGEPGGSATSRAC